VDLKGGDPSAALKNNVFKIKEGATFRLKVKFRVFGQIISGLKYIQVVKKHGITVGRDEEMLVSGDMPPVRKPDLTFTQGSYIPNSQGDSPFYEKTSEYQDTRLYSYLTLQSCRRRGSFWIHWTWWIQSCLPLHRRRQDDSFAVGLGF
jgi:hypothetical protein